MKTNLNIFRKGEIEIPYYTWPVMDPKAVLIFIHGLKSHAGWFAESGEAFAKRGIQVYAFDRRGSGHSPLPRGDIEDYRQWLQDIDAMVDLARREHPEHRPHLLGHCFGAKLALAYAAQFQGKFQSLVLIAPPQFALKADIRLQDKWKVLMYLLGQRNRLIPVPVRDEWFTRVPEWQQFIYADELRLKNLTARFCWQVWRADRRIKKMLGEIQSPTLILLAKEDDIVCNTRVKNKFYPRLKTQKKDLVEFDCYHHLLFEPRRDQVLDKIQGWLTSLTSC